MEMKKWMLLIGLAFWQDPCWAQTGKVTGVTDTSFSNTSEFAKLKKTYPFIQQVNTGKVSYVVEQKNLVYCNRGNRDLIIDAFIPGTKTSRPRAAIMIIHGGGWRSGHRSQHHAMARRLAELGYVCFTPEYRLSTEALYPAAVHDLKTALRWVHANHRKYNIDTGKVAVAGFSAGGQLAALLGTTNEKPLFTQEDCLPAQSTKLAAIIDMDGIVAFIHPESGEGDDSKKTSAATSWFGYSKDQRPDLWNEASALTHVSSKTPPTLFLNSSVERMHAGREDFISVLRQYKIYHAVKTFKGAPHSFPLFQPWFDSTVNEINKFLQEVFDMQAKTRKTASGISQVWVADNGNGTYKNPVLHADYSDPDAIRVGNDYYMTSSSFEDVPGLPILHSKDLVNWTIIGHALQKLVPEEHFSRPRHGEGVWAPSIRYHKKQFYIYYPDPDFGIYLVKADHPSGPWTEPILVEAGKGLIDPCLLWDDDGQAYLVHAFAGSRAGIKSILVIKKMNREGNKVIDDGVLVYDGHELDPTIEGPKLHKKDGYYYIFAPAGGVSTGWQLVLRSKNIYGPYERKVVMDQGSTQVNGPHQGAWVSTQTGEDWFLHFQDKEAYGRIVHLQPMKWKNGWPVIGADQDGDGKGEPVTSHRKPNVGKEYSPKTPAETDEFEGKVLGKQWQWMGNPKATWAFTNPATGKLRLYATAFPDSSKSLWDVPHTLLQKFPAEEFMVTTVIDFFPNPKLTGEKAGLAVMGTDYANIGIVHREDGNYIVFSVCMGAGRGEKEKEKIIVKAPAAKVYLRVQVVSKGICRFSYSFDGNSFFAAGEDFIAAPGRWKGAKVGLFCTRDSQTNDSGYADIDWFRVEPVE